MLAVTGATHSVLLLCITPAPLPPPHTPAPPPPPPHTLPRPRTRSAAVAGPVTPEFLQSCVRSQVKVTCNQHGKRSKTIAKTLYSRELASQPASQRAKAGPEYQMPPASWTARDAAAQG